MKLLAPRVGLLSLITMLASALLAEAAARTGTTTRPAASKRAPAVHSGPAVTHPVPDPAGEPHLFLRWNAPYGSPRASTTIDATCSAAGTSDTLYLSFAPGRDAPQFGGVSAVLYFHPAPGDTLSPFWAVRAGSLDQTPLRVVFDPDPDSSFTSAWTARGMGAPFYDGAGSSRRLRLIYAMAAGSGSGLQTGRLYVIARVLVRRPPPGDAACGKRVCIEWEGATVGFSPEDQVAVHAGERWVGLNPGSGPPCDAVAGTHGAPRAWKPGGR